MTAIHTAITAAIALLAASTPAFAQKEGSAKSATEAKAAKTAEDVAANWTTAPVIEAKTSRAGKVTVGGRTIGFTETAGTLTLRDMNGKPTGSIFYTAYTAPSTNGKRRPVTFLYNGGPGSSTVWLRMGSFAPMRVQTNEPQAVAPAPFPVTANEDTLIGSTDMVFLDAMGAGYSRPLGDTPASDFYGFDKDVDAFAKAITRYVTVNKRWGDPKYIFGESYGTPRSAALAYKLEDQGMALNGVILLSSIMNYGVRQPGLDVDFIGLFPSYAATAWYHNRIADRPADVATIVEQARQFANGPYSAALAKGSDITPAELDSVAQQMSRLTGLSPEFIKRANLRISLSRFRKELLRDNRTTIGRLDSRYTGMDDDAAGDRPEYDASSTGITGLYVGSFLQRLGDMGYDTDLTYRLSARDGADWKWELSHKAPDGSTQSVVDSTADLSAVMRINPHLRVLSLNGYYDMATPFFATEQSLKHMMLDPSLQKNLQFKYYESGHMIYLNPQSLHQMRLDMERYYAEGVR
ncbi:peptidase S10 [Sphingobium sp. CECT 9361]|uniref:S10 family peptidase n=1 Tax=Sphingobium sp. CECT 9361 TaxID=2845384 RepID=UPI001E5FD355|nr:peptidase S10 [Sphingobium sp. CECT 9361]CAH0349633.1 hypothetical protein SPH9361_00704 [Sphingobium sp. CECT 9361]